MKEANAALEAHNAAPKDKAAQARVHAALKDLDEAHPHLNDKVASKPEEVEVAKKDAVLKEAAAALKAIKKNP